MANAHLAIALTDLAVPTQRTPKGFKGFLARFMASLMATRRREAEREIARYVDGCGEKFTDETEREIERRFLSAPTQR